MLKSKVDLVKLVELMEKNDQKKLQLLNYLDQYPNRQVRNSELQDKLQISYYMFKRWTKEIVDDIATFQLDDRFSLEVTDASTILHEHHNTLYCAAGDIEKVADYFDEPRRADGQ